MIVYEERFCGSDHLEPHCGAQDGPDRIDHAAQRGVFERTRAIEDKVRASA